MPTPIVQQIGNCPVVEGQHTSPRKPTNNSDESQSRRTCREEEMGRSQEGATTKAGVQTDQDISTPQLFPNSLERSETDNVEEIGDFGFLIIQMVTVSGEYRHRGIAKAMYKHLIDAAVWRYPNMKFVVAWPLSMMDLDWPFSDMRAAGLDNDHQRNVAQLLTERLHLSMGFVPLGTSRWFVRSVEECRIQSRIAHESRSAQQQQTNQPAQHKKATELKGQKKRSPEQNQHASPSELRGQAKQSVARACDVPESIRRMSERLRKRRPSSSPSRVSPVLRNSPFSEPPPMTNSALVRPESVNDPSMSSLEEDEAADRSLAAELGLIAEPRESRTYGVQPNDELMTVGEMVEEFEAHESQGDARGV
ncbi:hypothetical protein BC567DRAFT_227221 [Phyllosticta citribraziliensis]